MRKYDRQKVYSYAKQWVYGRNPKYYNYDALGGDCTNFVSQCIFAGCGQMNYIPGNGWYYIDANRKSPSWTGVEFLYQFLISNRSVGPQGKISLVNELEIGDIIQLNANGKQFTHSVVVIQNGENENNTFVAAHTYDVFGKKLSDYECLKYRCIHIE